MKLVIGLGNPGLEYVNTPHNAGIYTASELEHIKLPHGVVVKKSNVFMNQSGIFVDSLLDKYKISPSDLYIIHDDLDIPLGSFKIQFGRGPKDHNGLRSIDEILGTNQYWHVRIGVDNRPADNRTLGEEYVLQNFNDSEKEILGRTIKEACKKLVTLLTNTK